MRSFLQWAGIFLLVGAAGVLSKPAVSADAYAKGMTRRHIELSSRLRQFQSVALKKAFLNKTGTAVRSATDASGSISGKVYGLDLASMGTAYVEAWMTDMSGDSVMTRGGYKGIALVDSNFTYRIDNLSPGDFYVVIWADGYDLQYFNGVSDLSKASKITVKDRTNTVGIDFRMTKPSPGTGRISGTVRNAGDGKPVAGAAVSVYSSDKNGVSYYYGKAMTDSGGRYTIKELKSGRYYGQVYADGFVWEMYDDTDDFTLARLIQVQEPNETGGIDFRIERSGSISGTVTDASGKPVGKAEIVAYLPSADSSSMTYPTKPGLIAGRQNTAYADPDGNYVVQGLKAGKYLVVAMVQMEWNPVYQWYRNAPTASRADTVLVKSGETTRGIDIRIPISSYFGSISGKVVDLDGEPVANAGIYVQTPSSSILGGSWTSRYVLTDSKGLYRADKLPPGNYYVSCWAQIGWRSAYRWWPDAETYEQAKAVVVESDSLVKNIDFRLPLKPETGSVAGAVRSTEGKPLKNASIQLQSYPASDGGKGGPNPVWAGTNTDSLGRYIIKQLPAGTYRMYASFWENDWYGQGWYKNRSDQASADPLVLIEGQKMSGVDFSLKIKPMYGTIVGTVKDSATGNPIRRAYVEITPSSRQSGFRPFVAWNFNTATDEKGRYTVEHLTEGTYLIAVYANGGFAYYKNAPVPDMADTLKIEGGQKVTANVALILRNNGKGSITGRVTSDWGSAGNDSVKILMPAAAPRPPMLAKGAPIDLAVVKAKPTITILSYPQSELFYTALADSQGNYTLKGLPSGDYFVSSFAPYHLLEYFDNAYDPAKAKLVRIENEKPVGGIDFALSPILWYYRNAGPELKTDSGTSLSGKVLDANGKPVSGATVYLLDGNGQPVDGVQTTADGSYELAGVQPGNYFIQASKPGYATQYNGTSADLSQTAPLNMAIGSNELNFTLRSAPTTGIRPPDAAHPQDVKLYGCYPNPFNPETRIAFELPGRTHVVLRMFNPLGQEVAVPCDRNLEAGRHDLFWRGTDKTQRPLPSGIYFYRLETPAAVLTGKAVLMR